MQGLLLAKVGYSLTLLTARSLAVQVIAIQGDTKAAASLPRAGGRLPALAAAAAKGFAAAGAAAAGEIVAKCQQLLYRSVGSRSSKVLVAVE